MCSWIYLFEWIYLREARSYTSALANGQLAAYALILLHGMFECPEKFAIGDNGSYLIVHVERKQRLDSTVIEAFDVRKLFYPEPLKYFEKNYKIKPGEPYDLYHCLFVGIKKVFSSNQGMSKSPSHRKMAYQPSISRFLQLTHFPTFR